VALKSAHQAHTKASKCKVPVMFAQQVTIVPTREPLHL
jgi:hypothetical protein